MGKNVLSVEKQLDRIFALKRDIQLRNIRLDEQVIERSRALHPKAQIDHRVLRGTGEWRTVESESSRFCPEAHPAEILNSLIVTDLRPIDGIDIEVRCAIARSAEMSSRQSPYQSPVLEKRLSHVNLRS